MKKAVHFFKFVALLLSIVFISCNKETKNNCGFSDPIHEIEWLNKAVEEVKEDEYAYFGRAKYKGETVFYGDNCNPAFNSVSFVQNCNGDTLGVLSDLYDKLSRRKVIWTHSNSECSFPK